MAGRVYYQEFVCRSDYDPVFAVSGLFRALHGLMRATGANLVLVPIQLDESAQAVLLKAGVAPAGVRVYTDEVGREHLQNALRLSAGIDGALLRRPLKEVVPERVQGVIRVSRLRTKTSPSVLKRFERRNPGKDSAELQAKVNACWKPRPGVHVWHEREGRRFPVFFAVEPLAGVQEMFECRNTQGAGTAPLVDFPL